MSPYTRKKPHPALALLIFSFYYYAAPSQSIFRTFSYGLFDFIYAQLNFSHTQLDYLYDQLDFLHAQLDLLYGHVFIVIMVNLRIFQLRP